MLSRSGWPHHTLLRKTVIIRIRAYYYSDEAQRQLVSEGRKDSLIQKKTLGVFFIIPSTS
jgi:hypothetical protein